MINIEDIKWMGYTPIRSVKEWLDYLNNNDVWDKESVIYVNEVYLKTLLATDKIAFVFDTGDIYSFEHVKEEWDTREL